MFGEMTANKRAFAGTFAGYEENTKRAQPPNQTPSGGTQMCSVHQKRRGMLYLEQDAYGNFVCKPDYACKGAAGDGTGLQLCSKHNKRRTLEMLILNATGQYECAHPNECKGNDNPGQSDQGTQMCAVHNKSRRLEFLYQDAYGQFVCRPENACKSGQGAPRSNPQSQQYNYGSLYSAYSYPQTAGYSAFGSGASNFHPYQMYHGGGPHQQYQHHQQQQQQQHHQPHMPNMVPNGATEKVYCATHGKQRTMDNMHPVSSHEYACKPGYECRQGESGAGGMMPGGGSNIGGATSVCSVHNKNRGLDYLTEDGRGGYMCQPGNECK